MDLTGISSLMELRDIKERHATLKTAKYNIIKQYHKT
ncbi:hypothetical protein Lser_V15G41138 [Lactuca serriola]